MKIVNQALVNVAEELARKFGYIEVEHKVADLMKDSFWGTAYYAAKMYLETKEEQTFEVVKYVKPIFEDELDPDKSRPKIETWVRFCNPRLSVYLPDGGMVSLEYKEDGTFAECQIFDGSGFEAAPSIKRDVEEWISCLKFKEGQK